MFLQIGTYLWKKKSLNLSQQIKVKGSKVMGFSCFMRTNRTFKQKSFNIYDIKAAKFHYYSICIFMNEEIEYFKLIFQNYNSLCPVAIKLREFQASLNIIFQYKVKLLTHLAKEFIKEQIIHNFTLRFGKITK